MNLLLMIIQYTQCDNNLSILQVYFQITITGRLDLFSILSLFGFEFDIPPLSKAQI